MAAATHSSSIGLFTSRLRLGYRDAGQSAGRRRAPRSARPTCLPDVGCAPQSPCRTPLLNHVLDKFPFSWIRRGVAASADVVSASPLLSALAATAAVLLALFFIGLTLIAPHQFGKQTSLTSATNMVSHGEVTEATLRDQDARLELKTTAGQRLWATYPHSDSYTGTLLALLQRKQVSTYVDAQSGKASLRAVVQFLLPILILVTLFAFFMTLLKDQGAAFAAFSKWTGSGQKAGEGRSTFADVAGAPEALIELREVCDYLENPGR